MKIKELLKGLELTAFGEIDPDMEICGVSMDSRKIKTGYLYVASPPIAQLSLDGHLFIADAIKHGAICIVAEHFDEALMSVPYFLAANPRKIAAVLCERIQGSPSKDLIICGVTGTNGKTSVTHILAHIFEAAGHKSALLGTLGYGDWRSPKSTGFTTPECEQLSALLVMLKQENYSHVCMEVSSHALASYRADGINFSAAAFTNLSQDHLDFHHDMASYEAAKDRLFLELLAGKTAALPYGHRLTKILPKVITWGLNKEADFCATNVHLSALGVKIDLQIHKELFSISSHLVGMHNVENLLCAAALAAAVNISPQAIAAGLNQALPVAGRMEKINAESGQGPVIYVDFAHKPGALSSVLQTVRQLCTGKIIVVFGCGGNRDSLKRPIMGEIAVSLADHAIICDDNPRTEKSADIISQITQGIIKSGRNNYRIIADRKSAIHEAISMAGVDDAVVVAGKGSEASQEINGQFFPFSDAAEVRAALASKKG